MIEQPCQVAMMTVIFEYKAEAPQESVIRTNMTDEGTKKLLLDWLGSKGVKPEDVALPLWSVNHRLKIQDDLQGGFLIKLDSELESELLLIELVAAAYLHLHKWKREPMPVEEYFV